MGLFDKILGKSKSAKTPKGFTALKVLNKDLLTDNMIRITLDVSDHESAYSFEPGQYITFLININGEELRRSYSICGGTSKSISVAVKRIENGKASNWLFSDLKQGDEILTSHPEGNFTRKEDQQNIVAIAAGSGITPIMSIVKDIENSAGNCQLFFGNRTEKDIPFKQELDELSNTSTHYYLSGEQKDGFEHGRLDKDAISSIVKKDLSLLKYDAFFICGPEEMIQNAESVLKLFGVSDEKIRFELFTTPVLLKKEENPQEIFHGTSKVKVVMDGEIEEFELKGDGKNILDAALEVGIDAPYSCKGGVCSTCKAKVLKGSARMSINYSLTDSEVEEGYILSCQAHPTSEQIVVSYDEA